MTFFVRSAIVSGLSHSARFLSPLLLGLAIACGDDGETATEQDDDNAMETPDGSADAGADNEDAGGSDDGPSAEELAQAESVLVRSCGACHRSGNPALDLLAENQTDVNVDKVRETASALIARMNDTVNPMPPAYASGDQLITAEEKALVIAYIESVSK